MAPSPVGSAETHIYASARVAGGDVRATLSSGIRAYQTAGFAPAPVGFQAKRTGGTVQLDLFDVIGSDFWGEGITAKRVQASLTSPAKTVRVRINSPGGDATEGHAIRSILRSFAADHDARIEVEIHGLAASAGTIVAMAGDTIHMAPDALFMIHESWSVVGGDADDLRHTAGVLDKINANMAALYAARSGQSIDDVRALMAAETWMNADDAKAQGFVDNVLAAADDDVPTAASPERLYATLAHYDRVPAVALARYQNQRGVALVAALVSPGKTEKPMNPDLLKLLGLSADADITAALAAVADLKIRTDNAEALAKEQRADAKTAREELAAVHVAQAKADVLHRIQRCQDQGKLTPADANKLREKFAARCAKGAVAVELFVEDLTDVEGSEPLPLSKRAVGMDLNKAPTADDPDTITDADRALYAGFDVSDEQILAIKRRFADAARQGRIA